MATAPFDEAKAVAALEATGRYRILRKLDPLTELHADDEAQKRVALFVDVETTGLDPSKDEIIELAMVRFTYSAEGVIYRVEEAYHGYQEPTHPITPEITRLTGIDAEMVAGQSIDRRKIAACIADADLILAHNAAFDRKFLERLDDGFVHKPWACSQSQVDWKAEGFEGTRLAYLVAGAGYFYDQHRALNDCYAAIVLLAQILPVSQKRALLALLEQARRKDIRIFASHAPFDKKDQLRARGYRWNGEGIGASRAWFIDRPECEMEDEIAWLEADIYHGSADPYRLRIDAFNRFSARV